MGRWGGVSGGVGIVEEKGVGGCVGRVFLVQRERMAKRTAVTRDLVSSRAKPRPLSAAE